MRIPIKKSVNKGIHPIILIPPPSTTRQPKQQKQQIKDFRGEVSVRKQLDRPNDLEGDDAINLPVMGFAKEK